MSVEIITVDQSTQIDTAIAGDFEAIGWRNHPGGDPDKQYIWWKSARRRSTSAGSATPRSTSCSTRAAPTPTKRTRADLRGPQPPVRRAGPQRVALVHAVDRRDGHRRARRARARARRSAEPFPGLAVGNPVAYMWVEQ